jgi:hypothetical protein
MRRLSIPLPLHAPTRTFMLCCAVVVCQSEVRSYSNERGAGKIGSLVLVDPSGSMKAVFFSELADKWMPVLEEGSVRARRRT